jgi:hypothetical protein
MHTPTCRTSTPSHKGPLLILLFLLCVVLAGPGSVLAKEASIADLVVSNSDTDLLLYLTVRDCFTAEMETGLHNGIPATFTFYVDLYQTRNAWPDRKIVSHVFDRTLTYDNLKEEYSIISSTNNKNATTQSLDQAKTLMSQVMDFNVIDLNRLDTEASYRLRVKVKLAKKTLPLYFHYLIPFSSLWDFETDWYTIEFRFTNSLQ